MEQASMKVKKNGPKGLLGFKETIEYNRSADMESYATARVKFVLSDTKRAEEFAENKILTELFSKHGEQQNRWNGIMDELEHGFYKAITEANPEIKNFVIQGEVMTNESERKAQIDGKKALFQVTLDKNWGNEHPGANRLPQGSQARG